MNELLRYLNIYAHDFVGCNLDFMYDGQRVRVQGDEFGPYVAESIITNKKFGFIKWLVDNDKIDTKELPYLGEYGMGIDFPTDNILMLLAISDTPIQDLCVWLK